MRPSLIGPPVTSGSSGGPHARLNYWALARLLDETHSVNRGQLLTERLPGGVILQRSELAARIPCLLRPLVKITVSSEPAVAVSPEIHHRQSLCCWLSRRRTWA